MLGISGRTTSVRRVARIHSMASYEIILGKSSAASPPLDAGTAAHDDWFDVVLDGERFSAATEPEQAACFLRDLVSGTSAVLEGRQAKMLVPLCDAPWEMCISQADTTPLLSFYRTGAVPEVRWLDRPMSLDDLVLQSRRALERMAPAISPEFANEVDRQIARLEIARATPAPARSREPDMLVRWRSRDEGRPARIAFETVLTGAHAESASAERADLHALLFRGRVSFDIRGQRGELAPGFIFLQIERLLSMCRPVLDACAARRALHLRVATGNSMLSLRLGTDGRLAWTVTRSGAASFTAPSLDARDFVLPVAEAGLALARAVVRCDRSRVRNLRLRAMRTEARHLVRRARDVQRSESKVNEDPAPYRASVISASATASSRPGMDLTRVAKLRYTERWRAEVEGLDLRGTLLCGDRLVVPGAREVCAIDRKSGEKLWSRTLSRAALALAGGDILRMTPRGDVELRDVRDGDTLWSTRLVPRVGAPGVAFSIHAAGLPRSVVLAEGERHLVSLDLRTGEPRWRHTARHAGAFKLRRAGRLLFVVSGDCAITALDVSTGETVWRYVSPAPFHVAPLVHRDVLVGVTGVAGRDAATIHGIDAFTGTLRWTREAGGPAASQLVSSSELFALGVSERESVVVAAFECRDGAPAFRVPVSNRPLGAAPIALNAFEDLLTANLPTGRVSAIEAQTGEVRWSRALAPPVGDDTPRRLDVQLRAGALFVPQSTLAVLRPRDGQPLANTDVCNLVPDLVRVDEECALYVGEESGHLAAFELGARLSLVPVP